MRHWQPAIVTAGITITVTPAGHPIFNERLAEWRAYWEQYRELPPLLMTADGWLVDGHHRLIVARELGVSLWGLIVERHGPHWVATGNVTRAV